jgi:hypothetical protein
MDINNVPLTPIKPLLDEELNTLEAGDIFIIRGSRYTCTWITRHETGFVLQWSGKNSRGVHYVFSRVARWDVTRIIKAADIKTRKRATYPFQSTKAMPEFQSELARAEVKDCTVRALTLAMSLPYEEAHRLLQVHTGRKANRGSHFSLIERHVVNGCKLVHQKTPYGWKFDPQHPEKRQRRSGMTIQQFLAQTNLPERCIVGIKGHVAAVINGVWHDTYRPGARSILTGYWTIEKVENNA